MYDAATAKTAAEAYQMIEANITILLADLLDKKREHAKNAAQQPENWGYAGDLAACQKALAEAVERVNVHWSGT